MSSYLTKILKSKLPHSTEIELHLFEFCNLSCSFCGQDHDSTEGLSSRSILEKADQVISFMKDNTLTEHTVNIMGGEIFNDEVPAEIFDGYISFYNAIQDWCEQNNHTARFNWVTNLIFGKTERVKNLLDHLNERGSNAYISTSYDFAGRGLDLNRRLMFKRNLEVFSDRITVIGFVLTRPAIRKIMNNTDRFFEDVLYNNYTLYFDYYVPELRADKMMPTEQEMLDCMLYVAEHYPNIYPIKDLLEREHNTMTCYSLNKTTILPDGKTVKCRYMEYEPDQFINAVDYSSNDNIIEAHLDKHGCLSCQWYDRCSFRCFVQADWAELERLDDCLFREFFNIAASKNMLRR